MDYSAKIYINMAYVYLHRRLDNNEIFYIGIGKNTDKSYKRAHLKARRNQLWKNIVCKTEYCIEILYDNITWEEACLMEKELIKKYGRRDLKLGTLTNFTDGGDGNVNSIITEKTRKQISNTLKLKNIKTTPKLTSDQVIDICNKLIINYSYQKIKKLYPILTRNMLCQIRTKRTWKEITNNYDFPKPTKEISDETKIGISKSLMGKCFNKTVKVKCLNDNEIFLSVRSASEHYNIPKYTIYRIVSKETKKMYGKNKEYKFEVQL